MRTPRFEEPKPEPRVAYPLFANVGELLPSEAPGYIDALWAVISLVVAPLPPAERKAVLQWACSLYPHQLDLIFDPFRFSILNKSRKIGATYAYAGAAVLWAMLGEETVIVSESENVAQRVIADAKKHAEALVRFGSVWAQAYGNKRELFFETGGRIVARPHTNAGRSFSGNVILDEFAYHDHPEKVWDAASAVATLGYRVRVLSTPNGVGNLFHTLCTDERTHSGWRVMQMSLTFARACGYVFAEGMKAPHPPTDADCWTLARNDPRVFDQLFGCVFIDADEQYLQHELVANASTATTEDLARLWRGETYGGCDIARTRDLFVICTVVIDRGYVWVLPQQTCRRTDWGEQRKMVAEGFETHKWRRLCVDHTGLGMESSEKMQRRHGTSKVELVDFSLGSKEDMATRLYEWLQEGRIKLLKEDAALRKDLYALRRLITAAGNIRYDAARTKDGHADRAWALMLALLAASSSGFGSSHGEGHGTMSDLYPDAGEPYDEDDED